MEFDLFIGEKMDIFEKIWVYVNLYYVMLKLMLNQVILNIKKEFKIWFD